jgi:aminopeptidase-like protein
MISAPQRHSIWNLQEQLDLDEIGAEMYELIRALYPLCRSITGEGLRETLRTIDRVAALDIREVPSGTRAFDWIVPKEWNIKAAYIDDLQGRRLIDFKNSNLHAMGYSTPVRKRVLRGELLAHIHSDSAHPDWIPYRNSYYKENWGFCVSQKQLATLTDDKYDVCIDSTLENGSLSYGEIYLAGESPREVLISTHACHPSLCNDNLSGIAVAAMLAKHLRTIRTRYSYRFLFVPCTIGPITWLSRNEEAVSRIDHGLILACLGDSGGMTYVRSRRDTAEIDRVMRHVLEHSGQAYQIRPFAPYGYDQRQYCSPGFDLPMGCLMRTPNGEYPEYHTSADNLELMKPESLADSFAKILSALCVLEDNKRYIAQVQYGEPHLGRRGLYDKAQEYGLFWLLNYSDGKHSVFDIAEKSGVPFAKLAAGVKLLEAVGLLSEIDVASLAQSKI